MEMVETSMEVVEDSMEAFGRFHGSGRIFHRSIRIEASMGIDGSSWKFA